MLRYKKSILHQLNLYDIETDLEELAEVAYNVVYAWDDDNLLEALVGPVAFEVVNGHAYHLTFCSKLSTAMKNKLRSSKS